jgi:hydrogenase expression/formation protein HypC
MVEVLMCLAVPARIVSLSGSPTPDRMGRISCGGVFKDISLAFTPEAEVGDWVIVHAGFAITRLDEAEAEASLAACAAFAAEQDSAPS